MGKSYYSVLSIYGILAMMSILACFSFCSVLSWNSAFSVASLNSVASIASVNCIFSIASMNCVGCIFNVPLNRGLPTCDKYSFTEDEDDKELLYGRAYKTFSPSTTDLSEEDLANDCCLYIHSS